MTMRRLTSAALAAFLATLALAAACGRVGEEEAAGPRAGGGSHADDPSSGDTVAPPVAPTEEPSGGGVDGDSGTSAPGGGGSTGDPNVDPTQCGQSPATIDPNADPDDPVSYTPCDEPSEGPKPHPTPVSPQPGMTGVHKISWSSANVAEDDRTVTITFYSGIEPCAVLDHVDVAYRAHEVEITLFEGRDPAKGDVACIEIAVLKSVRVVLDEPLDGRDIAGGADDR